MSERRGTKALETWCRRMTDGYPGVKIDNMTTSWRNGLAFCAIIHHFRPDLIDFSKLNKDDIYYNNNLAFRVAERHLGIPALLDAEDMVEYEVPDRLSILTYLSQFYQVFGNAQGSPTRIVAKRPAVTTDRGMVSPTSTSPPTKMAVRNSVGITGSAVGRREPCAKCGYPVFLAERLHVGPKLYHRTCFRCARCNNQLSLANCYETETDGQFCCETCPDEEDATPKAEDVPDTKFNSLSDFNSIKQDININSTENLTTTQKPETKEVRSENSVMSKIKLFDATSAINRFEVKHVPTEMRNRSLSDEEKSRGLHEFDEDEYSSYFENALEEANDKIPQENNALSQARNNFLSTHMLNEDFDEIESKTEIEETTFDDVEDEFESLYKELTHEDKTKVIEFDEMKVDYVETPPPLPSTKPPDISVSLVDDEPTLAKVKSEPTLEEKPDEAVAKTIPDTGVNSSDKDNVKDDQQITASDTRLEEVTNITDKNVTKDTNRTSLVKSRMLIFENAEKSTPSTENSKPNKKSDEPMKLDISNVPSDTEIILISDSDSSILSTKDVIDTSACENCVEIISDTSVSAEDVDVEQKTDDSMNLFESIVNITSDESQVVVTPSDIDTSYEDNRVKYEPEISDSVTVDSSLTLSTSRSPPVDTQKMQLDRKILTDSIFENTSLGESRVTIDSSILASSESSKVDYPEELNPFGDEINETMDSTSSNIVPSGTRPVPVPRKCRMDLLKNTNPFGSSDDDTEEEVIKNKPPLPPQPTQRAEDCVKKLVKAPRVSLNPFWSEEDEPSDEDVLNKPIPLPRSSNVRSLMNTPEPRARKPGLSKNGDPYDSNSSLSSMSSSISHTPGRKKKPAPPPPTQMGAAHYLSPQTSKHASPQISPKLTPRIRKNRKAPLPPTSTPCVMQQNSEPPDISPINDSMESDKFNTPEETKTDMQQAGETEYYSLASPIASSDLEKEKITKDEKNRNRQSQNISSPVSEITSDSVELQSPVLDKSTHGIWKRKKGPAPARPVPQRRQIKPLPLTELRRELDIIEMQQQGLEKQGVKLEQLIREKCEGPGASDDTALSADVEELVLELFEMVNEKNELFRRQAELMYLRRQQRLEEEYADLEYQIRCLMDRPERNKTDSDKAREEELINRLVEVVETRNEIVECLEMDRVREAEEDQSINSRLNLIAAKREEESQCIPETPVKLSKKEKKKMKKEKKLKEKGKNLDVDKDIDESESSLTSIKEKKKKKWF